MRRSPPTEVDGRVGGRERAVFLVFVTWSFLLLCPYGHPTPPLHSSTLSFRRQKGGATKCTYEQIQMYIWWDRLTSLEKFPRPIGRGECFSEKDSVGEVF